MKITLTQKEINENPIVVTKGYKINEDGESYLEIETPFLKFFAKKAFTVPFNKVKAIDTTKIKVSMAINDKWIDAMLDDGLEEEEALRLLLQFAPGVDKKLGECEVSFENGAVITE